MLTSFSTHLLPQSTPIVNRASCWHLIFASMLILYLIFSSSIHILHYSGDDFKYSFGSMSQSCAKNDGYHFMLTVGRPLQTFIDCLGFKFAYTLNGMRIIRIATVATMGVVMGLLADWFCTLGFSLALSFFVAGDLLLIAHLYGDAVPMGAIPLPFTLLLTLIAYRCVNHAHLYSLQDPHTRKQAMSWLIGSFLAVLAALLTYPALAFFFVTLMLSKLLFSNLQELNKTRDELLKETMVFVVSCIIYFVWAYYNVHYHPRTEIPPAYQIGHPNIHPVEMFKRLILLSNLFSSWWPLSPMSDSLIQGWIMIAGLSSIIVAGIKLLFKPMPSMIIVQATIGVRALLILSSAFLLIMPNLEIVENRVLYAAVASVCLLAFWGLLQWKQFIPFKLGKAVILMGMGGLFFIEGYQASTVILVNALSHVQYLDGTRHTIADYLHSGQPLKRIHFIIPQSNSPYDRYPLAQAALVSLLKNNSFKLRWCAWAPLQKSRTIEAANCLAHLKKNHIAVTYSVENEPILKTAAMVMIKNHYESLDLKNLKGNEYA